MANKSAGKQPSGNASGPNTALSTPVNFSPSTADAAKGLYK